MKFKLTIQFVALFLTMPALANPPPESVDPSKLECRLLSEKAAHGYERRLAKLKLRSAHLTRHNFDALENLSKNVAPSERGLFKSILDDVKRSGYRPDMLAKASELIFDKTLKDRIAYVKKHFDHESHDSTSVLSVFSDTTGIGVRACTTVLRDDEDPASFQSCAELVLDSDGSFLRRKRSEPALQESLTSYVERQLPEYCLASNARPAPEKRDDAVRAPKLVDDAATARAAERVYRKLLNDAIARDAY